MWNGEMVFDSFTSWRGEEKWNLGDSQRVLGISANARKWLGAKTPVTVLAE